MPARGRARAAQLVVSALPLLVVGTLGAELAGVTAHAPPSSAPSAPGDLLGGSSGAPDAFDDERRHLVVDLRDGKGLERNEREEHQRRRLDPAGGSNAAAPLALATASVAVGTSEAGASPCSGRLLVTCGLARGPPR